MTAPVHLESSSSKSAYGPNGRALRTQPRQSPGAVTTSVRRLLAPAYALERLLARAAERAGSAAGENAFHAKRSAEALTRQRKEHEKAQSKLADGRERHIAAQSNLSGDLLSLPGEVKRFMPALAEQITVSHIESARESLTSGKDS